MVALETELECLKGEVACLMERVTVCKQQMWEAKEAQSTMAVTETQEGDGNNGELTEALAQLQIITKRQETERETTIGLRESLKRIEEWER